MELPDMDDLKILDGVRTIVSERLMADVSSVDTDLLETGALDSVSLVELLVALEQRFGVSFELAELEIDNFRSIKRIAQLVSDQRAARTAERR